VNFTKDAVAALAMPAGKVDHITWDDSLPGFGVRLRSTRKSWVVQYRVGKQQRRESLGDVRKVGLDAARKIARQRFAQIELGLDPRANKIAAEAAAARGLTLAAVAEKYLDAKRPKLRPASYEAARRYLTLHWRPLAVRPLASIGRADVAARLQELAKEHGRVAASRARATLAALFGWAAREGLVEVNVVTNTNDPNEGAVSRERVLKPDEVQAIWHACTDMGDFGAIVKLLLLTGQRRNEIAHLRWSEVSFKESLIKLPATRVKNGRAHDVPMSSAVIDILKAQPRYLNADGGVHDLVFGNGKPFSSWSNSKLALDRKITDAGKELEAWSLHDCRRTCASGMQQLGVRVEVIERALNHVSGAYKGVTGIYQRDAMLEERHDALGRWARRVLAIVQGRKFTLVRDA
jgi:integrase